MRFFLVAMMLALPLAGCLDAPVDDVQVPEVDTPDAPQVHGLEGVLNLEVTQARTPVGGSTNGFLGSNCQELLASDVHRAVRIALVMEWNAMSPLTEEMELIIDGEEGAIRVTGSSPLELVGEDVTPDSFFESIHVIAQAANPGASVDQPVTIGYTVDYEGEAGAAFQPLGACSWG